MMKTLTTPSRRRVRSLAATAVLALAAVSVAMPATGSHAQPALGGTVHLSGGSTSATSSVTMTEVAQAVRASDAAKTGTTGRGIGVAVIDSGVTRVAGLANSAVVD